MDEVSVVSLAVGRCVDACCLLLDLLATMSVWLLRFLSAAGASLCGAPGALSGSAPVDYWNSALFSFLAATEAVCGAACGALRLAEGWLRALGGVFESFKMVGHLLCHVAWRIKDALQRGLLSGSCILRQTCDGVCIALSLVLYFVNTVVNLVLIGTQNCASALAGVWEVVVDPVRRVVELALTLLTFLYSCLVGASVLLWTPCQLLLDFLGGLGRVLVTVFVADSQGLLITAAVASLVMLVLNPRLPVLARRLSLHLVGALPGARSVQTILEQAATDAAVQTRTVQEVSGTHSVVSESDLLPATEVLQPDPLQLHALQDGEPAGTSAPQPRPAVPGGGRSPPTDGELLSLLKEQEERKKCVICQDLSKTVLLLPCRHLCLCRHCADILTQRRSAQQRSCPLCRQPITQTMDVFL
ncbi:E3 ubiquitin-protein ligase RNF26-like [Pempheris klunzingeri]|uniref:E3 ubiquitin-protein ligase RNF26-like n=1 Tax=Pempheris klunzingeri TaxID=3127111 RepID=UPI00398091E2